MGNKFGIAMVVALLVAPVVVHAQGIIGGMQRGAAEGNYAAGPVGGVVGGAVGGAVGGVNGALGVNPPPRYSLVQLITIAGTIAIITITTTDRSGKKKRFPHGKGDDGATSIILPLKSGRGRRSQH